MHKSVSKRQQKESRHSDGRVVSLIYNMQFALSPFCPRLSVLMETIQFPHLGTHRVDIFLHLSVDTKHESPKQRACSPHPILKQLKVSCANAASSPDCRPLLWLTSQWEVCLIQSCDSLSQFLGQAIRWSNICQDIPFIASTFYCLMTGGRVHVNYPLSTVTQYP